MPELPEVESFKQYFDATTLGQKIKEIKIKDKKTIIPAEESLVAALEGQTFETSYRIGKYLLSQSSAGPWLMFHFGMTGYFQHGANSVPLPRFSRLVFYLENGYYLSYICPRKFGKIDLYESLEAFRQAKNLSDDALVISLEDFSKNIHKRKAAIKTVLLDQKVCAGIGNWIADEMLFHSKIHPEQKANTLTDELVEVLYLQMKDILDTALDKEADYNQYPDYYMIHRRGWTDLDTDTCATCKTPIDYFKVGGRATYICPNCQKK